MHQWYRRLLCCLLLMLAALGVVAAPVRAQPDTTRVPTPSADTLHPDTLRSDSLSSDTSGAAITGRRTGRRVIVNPSGVDTVIVYSARDSIVADQIERTVTLYGDASVRFGGKTLTAELIVIDLKASTVVAMAQFDSTTREEIGPAVFTDGAQKVTARRISYDFKTGVGRSEAVQTAFGDGYYYGEKIKRVAQKTVFIQDGYFTTCDEPQPHYYFHADRMRADLNDKIYLDEPTLAIEGVPIAKIPVGLYFDLNRQAKASGLIVPTWERSPTRGFSIIGLGYYWAGNDYIDAKVTANLYSKGGYEISPTVRFRLRHVIDQADLTVKYSQTRNDPDDPLNTNWTFDYAHQQQLGTSSRLGGNVRFATGTDPIRRTTSRADLGTTFEDVTTRTITSDLSYSTSWDFGSLSLGYRGNQDIVTGAMSQTIPSLSLRINQVPLLGSTNHDAGVLGALSFGAQTSLAAVYTRGIDTVAGVEPETDWQRGMTISPYLSWNPDFGKISVSPSFNPSIAVFNRRMFIRPSGDTGFVNGIYPVFAWSAGVRVQTRLYGLIRPGGIFGVDAIRHTITPSVSFTYNPDFPRYYSNTYDRDLQRVSQYYVFARDAGLGITPSRTLAESVSLSIANTFDAKIRQSDTGGDRTVTWGSINLSTGYNAAADSLAWSPLTIGLSAPVGWFTLTGRAGVQWYRSVQISETRAVQIDEFHPFVSNANLTFSATLSDQGLTAGALGVPEQTDTLSPTRGRFVLGHVPFDPEEFHGTMVRGQDGYRVPWSMTFGATYYLTRRAVPNPIDQSRYDEQFDVRTDLSLKLTPTTNVTASLTFDVLNGDLQIPTISFVKDLHCWEMKFDWSPLGPTQAFRFSIGLKAPELSAIKYEQRSGL